MQHLSTGVLIAPLAIAGLASAAPAAAQETSLLVNCFFPPQHFMCQEILPNWAASVAEVTEGRVAVEFPPQNMAPPPEQMTSVRAGVFDGALQLVAFIENEATGLQVAMLPLTGGADARANSLAFWRTYEQFLDEAEPLDGVELLWVVVAPGADFYSLTGTPINSLEDVAKRKMWASAGDVADILSATGSAVVSGPAVQMSELIQRGVVDGFVGIPATDAMAFNLIPSVQSVTRTERKISTPAFGFFVNADRWAEISPEDQDAIRAVSGETFAEMAGRIWAGREEAVLGELDAVVEVIQGGAAFEDELAAQSQPVIDAWLAAAAEKGIDGQAALDFYRAEVARRAGL